MDTQRSTAYISRHGKAPQVNGQSQDELLPGEPHAVYGRAGLQIIKPIIGQNCSAGGCIEFGHSGKKRAYHTNMAILAAVCGLSVPETIKQAKNIEKKVPSVGVRQIHELGYEDFIYSQDEMAKVGYRPYAEKWFTKGFAGRGEAVQFLQTRKNFMDHLIGRLMSGEKRVMVYTTHSPTIEACAVAGFNHREGSANQVKGLGDIGGFFDVGGTDDYLLVNVDRHTKSGSLDNIEMVRKGKAIKLI